MEKSQVLPLKRKSNFTKIIAAILLFLVLVVYFAPNNVLHSDQVAKTPWKDIRLPDFIHATNYKLNFTTNLHQSSFEGSVEIGLKITQKTRFIVIHNLDLEVKFKHLRSDKRSIHDLQSMRHYPDKQYSILVFKKPLAKGSYALGLHYHGTLNTNLAGYYISTYYDQNEIPHNIATTQFEPTDARRAFPCLDEPSQKAIFEITMQVQDTYHAISNMPIKSITPRHGWKEFQFEKTVKMSTYLVAFIVSDFEKISKNTSNNVTVSVYTAPGKTELGEYALKIGVPILEFYQKSFGIDFPLPKLDMIAIPDFAAGAMENWGLVTYRDTALLYDPKTSAAANKDRVASVVAHELAHQWFGNLVTMKWWSDLWLNEGFATFMEYKAVDYAEPLWNFPLRFISDDLVRALHADESYYTHQIAIPVKNPAEISSIFDDISYGKGSSILRMLEAWMNEKYGKTVFFEKLHGYLTKHAYGNAETKELWEALRIDDQDVGAFMKTWTDQPGFPVLTFDELSPNSVTVQQERFIFASLIGDPERDVQVSKQVWSVPLSYAIYSNSTGKPARISRGFTEISKLGKRKIKFESSLPPNSILLANFLQTGVYRSLYDQQTYYYLIDWLNHDLNILPAVERGGLISDVFSMTFSGLLYDPTIAFELLQLLRRDTNILVWDTALKDVESLKNIFALHPAYGAIVGFESGIIENVIREVGWKEKGNSSDVHGRALLRGRLLSEAVRNGHAESVEIALGYFRQIKEGKTIDVETDVLSAIYDAGVIFGDLHDYEFVRDKFLASTFAPEQQVLLHALASSKTPYLQAKTLEFAISGKVRKQDIQRLIAQVNGLSPIGHISVWVFLMDNWEKILGLFEGSGFSHLNDLLQGVTASFTKVYLINEAERLFVEQSNPDFKIPHGARKSVLKGLETAKQLLAWRKIYGEQVTKWLEDNVSKDLYSTEH